MICQPAERPPAVARGLMLDCLVASQGVAPQGYRQVANSPKATMAPQALKIAYRLENFPELQPLLERARESMSARLKADITRAIDDGEDGFARAFQLDAPATEQQRTYAIGELADSYKNETDYQRLGSEHIEDILFGPIGLIKRSGGGSPMPLQRDILIGWIVVLSKNIEIGPVICGGRHRFMALQIMLKAACPEANIDRVRLRCVTRHFKTRDDMVRAIFADQEGRKMGAAEKRERKATGLDLTSRGNLIASLTGISRKDYPTALGAFVKLSALEQSLNGLTLDQYAAAGVTAYNTLLKFNRGLNQQVADSDGAKLIQFAEIASSVLPDVVPDVVADRRRGPKNTKLGRVLARKIAARCNLAVDA